MYVLVGYCKQDFDTSLVCCATIVAKRDVRPDAYALISDAGIAPGCPWVIREQQQPSKSQQYRSQAKGLDEVVQPGYIENHEIGFGHEMQLITITVLNCPAKI